MSNDSNDTPNTYDSAAQNVVDAVAGVAAYAGQKLEWQMVQPVRVEHEGKQITVNDAANLAFIRDANSAIAHRLAAETLWKENHALLRESLAVQSEQNAILTRVAKALEDASK